MASLPHIQIMSRRECGLCDSAKAVVRQAADQGLCTWEIMDVGRDKALLVRYGMDVPVVLVDGMERFRHRIDADALHTALEACEC